MQASIPIIPIMLGDARVAVDMADRLLAEGVYVIGFSFPVVPQGKAASAPRCQPGSHARTSSAPWVPSSVSPRR